MTLDAVSAGFRADVGEMCVAFDPAWIDPQPFSEKFDVQVKGRFFVFPARDTTADWARLNRLHVAVIVATVHAQAAI